MYTALYEAHRGFAMLGCLTTVLWAAFALIPTLQRRPPSRLWRPFYISAMATTGLSGVTGLVILWYGAFLTFVFPWLGLVAVALHGVAGVRGRKALAVGAAGTLAAAVIVQIVTLVVIYGLMTVKPF
ncbi:hypothetical protein [Pleomorphomonas koreensis]|uniref:hypothetical protein n=1 Tax=Pleomorphomonas koreensis TaxID=257440 RepID=UPI00041EFF65|nr:hypothetical protein [Pleomorphomonas koreensis]